ncbi:MAG: lnt [Bacteroidetes bacterium]|nr:lnt [Bacteroidota bacterium]
MQKSRLVLLSVFSGVLLALGWFPNGIFPFLFFGFIPLLIVEEHFYNNRDLKPRLLFALSYLAFFIWNILTTWWIKNASFGGAALAIICNALLMSFTFMLFHSVKKRIGQKWSSVLFICFWISFEFFHNNWELSWPWLTLGNAFADTPSIIQWYEYTGIFGGSLWILVMNVFLLNFILNFKTISKKQKWKDALIILTVLVVPMIVSVLLLPIINFNKGGISVVVVQPNIDPYNEKFEAPYDEQLKKMLALAGQKITSETDYVIFPETALVENNIQEESINQSGSVAILNAFLKKYPKLKIITGASTMKVYKHGEELSVTARKFTQQDDYYDSYNTALQLDTSEKIQIYHKSKLVPGVEQMPFPFIFKHLEGLAIDLGGTTGGLGTQTERTVFASPDNSMKAAPVVCYESIYGEYVSEYVRNGANFIAIITNDGWWGNTPGYKQHLRFGALRAIETRRWIVRSANTGISCFIDPYGKIIKPTKWWTPDVIEQQIQLHNDETFYTKYGDYIARAALCITFAMLIYSLLIRFRIIKKS